MNFECEMRGNDLYVKWKGMPAGKLASLAYGALTQMEDLGDELDKALDCLSLYEVDEKEDLRSTTMKRLEQTLGGHQTTTLAIGEVRSKHDVRKWYDIQLGVQPDLDAVLITPAEYAPEGILRRVYTMIRNEAVADDFFRAAKAAIEGKEQPTEPEQPPKGRRRIDELE